MRDPIERQAAIDALADMHCKSDEDGYVWIIRSDAWARIDALPSAQPEPIKINIEDFNKEDWERLKKEWGNTPITVLPAQPDVIYCKDCKYQEKYFHADGRRKDGGYYIFGCELADGYSHVCLDDDFCSRAERREE